MKRLKGIINELKNSADLQDKTAEALIREFIFYSPKMPLRLHQEQLLAEAKHFSLKVFDAYFTGTDLTINVFSWGSGKTKVLLTHGWASKAADFYELIIELRKNDDLEIIAFDAPGNGSSISEFSNLMLYVESVKSIAANYVKPDAVIGHSLGGMANVLAIQALNLQPKLSVSIAPLIRLKENFEQSMDAVAVSPAAQDNFFRNFELEFSVKVDYFNLTEIYNLKEGILHFLAYDEEDHISPYPYLKIFLDQNVEIESKKYDSTGHYKILKSAELIQDIIEKVKKTG